MLKHGKHPSHRASCLECDDPDVALAPMHLNDQSRVCIRVSACNIGYDTLYELIERVFQTLIPCGPP